MLSTVGLLLAAVTSRLDSWALMLFSLLGPVICALGASLIAINGWGPAQAANPIRVLLGIYVLGALPLAVSSLVPILNWEVILLPSQRRVWQYSLKSLFVLMTAVCVLAAATQFVVRNLTVNLRRDESLIFFLF